MFCNGGRGKHQMMCFLPLSINLFSTKAQAFLCWRTGWLTDPNPWTKTPCPRSRCTGWSNTAYWQNCYEQAKTCSLAAHTTRDTWFYEPKHGPPLLWDRGERGNISSCPTWSKIRLKEANALSCLCVSRQWRAIKQLWWEAQITPLSPFWSPLWIVHTKM